MTKRVATVVKISAVLTVLIVAWFALSYIVAERNTEPSYILTAGNDHIRQEWGYCTRFDNETKNLTFRAVRMNTLNNSLFAFSRPIFRLQNWISGKRIGKGDANYDQYMKRVRLVRSPDWDYVISSHPDGRELYAVKKKAIVQKVD